MTMSARRLLVKVLLLAAVAAPLAATAAQTNGAGPSGKPRIALIGSGNVGSNLGKVWVSQGYAVMFSSKDIEADRRLAAQIGTGARAGTPQEAAAYADVLVFAVPYGALPELGKSLGPALKGKVVIDASNPFPQRDGAIADEARAQGAGIVTARLLPGARIVRAFNAIAAARMGAVHATPGKVGMPMASDDMAAVEVASVLVRDIGFEPVLVGKLDMGKFLMPGTPLAGEHTPDEIRQIVSTLKP
jgi:8-hydroxy-5-deazaflavin:NADPH oxidoreductase